MVDALSSSHFAQNLIFILMRLQWDEHEDGLTYDFIRGVSTNLGYRIIPSDSIQGLTDDCVVGRVNCRGKRGPRIEKTCVFKFSSSRMGGLRGRTKHSKNLFPAKILQLPQNSG